VFVVVGFGTEILHVDLVCSEALVRRHTGKETHLELTVARGSKEYSDAMPLAKEFFSCE